MSVPITKEVEVRVKSIDLENFTVDADVSDESIDRHGEIILLSSWQKRLGEYLKNPLLCWQHPVGGWGLVPRQPEDILGKSILTEVTATSLFCRFQYAVNVNPKAEMCFRLIAGDYLRSYSIGAIPYGPIYCDAPEMVLDLLPAHARAALKNGDCWCVHAEMELLEVSNVFVGANREALARACRDGVITRSLVPDLFKSINASTGTQWAVAKQLATAQDLSALAELRGEVKSLRELIEASKQVEVLAEAVQEDGGQVVETEAVAVVEHSTEDLFAAVIAHL